MIYLDNNATSQIAPLVAEGMSQIMSERPANPSSQHSAGRKARQVVESARESLLSLCGARTSGMASDHLIFTSGGTESNNLALFGLTENKPGAVVVSAIEHPSVLAAAEHLSKQGREVRYLPGDSSGVVSLDRLQEWLSTSDTKGSIALVSLMLANNETGVLQPVEQAARMCRNAGVMLHTDAVQVLGKQQIDFTNLDVDAMTITAHKLHGPVGIGALILRNGLHLEPRAFGGFQQLGLRPGTESAVLARGFEIAARLATNELDQRWSHMQQLRDRLQTLIVENCSTAVVIGAESKRLPHTLSLSFRGLDRQAIQLALDQVGVACSTGSACASGSSQNSHVLEAMRLAPEVVRGGIRFSLSHETTADEIEQAATLVQSVVNRLSRFRRPFVPS